MVRWFGKSVAANVLAIVLLSMFSVVSTPGAQIGSNIPVAKIIDQIITVPVDDKSGLRFRRLSVSEGLSQTRVSQIVQDDEGYIWFGSQYGISQFDGYEFRNFSHSSTDQGSLSGVFVYALFKDRAGTVWVGSDQYLDAYDRDTETFRHYPIAANNPTVIHISQDSDGLLWLSTAQGLFTLDPSTKKISRYGHDRANPNSLMSDDIKSTGEDRAGQFWVASSFGLERFDRSTGQVTYRIPLPQKVRELGFHEDSRGTFWIFYGAGNGLAIFDKATNSVRRLSFDSSADEANLRGVYSLIETSEGDIWLATMGFGLLKFNREKFAFERYINDPHDDQSIAENRAIALFQDRETNIWVGLHAMPPNVFSTAGTAFRKVWPPPKMSNETGEALVNAVFEDRDGNAWLGAGGMLNRVDRLGAVENFTPGGPNERLEVLSINQDSFGTVWVGTLGAGLFSIDPISRAIRNYRHEIASDRGPSSDVITRIFFTSDGTMWLTTWNGLNRYDRQNARFVKFTRPQPASNAFFSLVPTPEGDGFWIGSTSGLLRFRSQESTFETFAHDPNDGTTISNNTINSVLVDSDGVLWVGTQNGLNKLRSTGKGFDTFFTKDGLPGNVVSCILTRSTGDLWLSTNHGVARVDRKTMNVEAFSTQDGIPGDDLTGWNACAQGVGDTLYFGGFSGATITTGKGAQPPHDAPPVIFTSIRAGGRQVVMARDRPRLSLAHDENLEVSFAAINFRDPRRTRYRYRLDGLDEDWHSVPNAARTLNFPYLPSGSYELIVQAALQRGNWPSESTKLSLIVVPAWWQTWWSYGLAAASLIGLASLYMRYRTEQVRAVFRMRLEERLSERTRLARELHDTLLQSFQGLNFRLQAVRNILFSEPEKAAAILEDVLEKGDDALVEGRGAIHALRDPGALRQNLGHALGIKGRELAASFNGSKRPHFEMMVTGDPLEIDPDTRDDLYRIASEALQNAFSHSGASEIDCRLDSSLDGIEISIKDNGAGHLAIGADNSGRRGWGVTGMRERAEHIGAILSVDSLKGLGTRVSVKLPAKGRRSTIVGWMFRR